MEPSDGPVNTKAGAAVASRPRHGRPKKTGADSVPIIKDAALRLFAQKGYANTSLDEIAAVVGFTKGGVYYYFRSKEQLLLDILADIESRSIGETSRQMLESDASSLAKLVLFNDMQARWASLYPGDLAILMLTSIETANEMSTVGDRVRAIYQKMEVLLGATVEQGKKSGEISAAVPTRDMVLSLMAIHDGNMLLWYRSGCRPETGRVLAAIAKQTLLDRFKAPRHGPTRSRGG